jgi:hypothetical protein
VLAGWSVATMRAASGTRSTVGIASWSATICAAFHVGARLVTASVD